MMNTGQMIERTYSILNHNHVFWTEAEVVDNGLCPAQRLVALLNPSLLVQRTVIALQPHQVLLDLRVEAPRAWRVERVALGDATQTTVPLPTTRHGDLRKTTLAALRSHRDWFKQTAAYPGAWYQHGMVWIGLYPRHTQSLTITLVASALPLPLSLDDPERSSELPAEWHPVVPEIAASLLQCKEGAGPEVDQAIQRLQSVVQAEPLTRLQKRVLAEQRKAIYGQQMRATIHG
jgi:hypothetical protein